MGRKFIGGGKLGQADGFTLIELLVTMAILTILGAFAVPQWGILLSKYRLDAAARQVATELHGAKNRAMAQYRRFKLVFDLPTTSYTIQKEQTPGEGDYAAISGSKSLPLGITVTFNNTPVFQTRGNASPGATITLTNSNDETKQVAVALTGRIEIR